MHQLGYSGHLSSRICGFGRRGCKLKRIGHLGWLCWLLAGALAGAGTTVHAQQNQQNIPDAPSASRPAQPLPSPNAPAAPPSAPSDTSAPAAAPPDNGPPPSEPRPPMEIKTVPEGGATPSPPSSPARDQLFTLRKTTNFVVVPVTVKDRGGRMVNGLLSKDFIVFENGHKQKLTFFTSDPFFLSAAVILDYGLPDVAVQKVAQTFTD